MLISPAAEVLALCSVFIQGVFCQSEWPFTNSPPSPNYIPDPPNITLIVVLSIIGSLISLVIIIVVSYHFAKKARGFIVNELPTVISASSNNSRPQNQVQVWEADAPTMEKFLQEIAREKPVRFTAQQLYSFTQNYSSKLGSGGFGVVYQGQFPNGLKMAVKVLNKSSDRAAEEQFMAEVATIGKTYHINLVRLYGFCHDQYMSALVYEYMENGSLDKYLFGETQQLEWERLHEIAIGTSKGLAYLHEECQQRIVHYDIKPANILLDSNFNPKVADFGLAKLCNRENTHVTLSGYRGTPGYSAPEFMLKNYPITHKCDVYSFGMVLFEIVGRRRNTCVDGKSGDSSDSLDWFPKHVWEEYEKRELSKMMVACGIEEKHKEKAQRMCVVALWCVQDSPEARPPMSAVVKMLEGDVEVVPPPKPFHYLFSVGMAAPLKSSSDTAEGSSYTSSEESKSRWYKETTPVMAKYEIQMASS